MMKQLVVPFFHADKHENHRGERAFVLPQECPALGPDCDALEDRILFNAAVLDAAVLDALDAAQDGSGDVAADGGGTAGWVDCIAEDAPTEAPDPALIDAMDFSGDSGDSLDGQVFDKHDEVGSEQLDAVQLDDFHVDVLPIDEASNVTAEIGETSTDGSSSSAGPIADLSQTFFLHSNPGASHTIYLDFDGHVTEGTPWNNTPDGSREQIVTPAYDVDGDLANFSADELTRIQEIWARVAEDFVPFDVDVTTEDPGVDALTNSGVGDTTWGQRVVIGGSSSDWTGTSVGGIAYLGSFDWSSDTPVFVFENNFSGGLSTKGIAGAISHETGHTLGLGHDGTSSSSYYSGHGSGETSWGPIMGTPSMRELSQWSQGEYPDANNQEDDLAIITSQNGFGYRVDDHGDTFDAATLLSGSDVLAEGIIEQNTDYDLFSFSTSGGTLDLHIDPIDWGANLDILAEVYDADHHVIFSSNPVDLLDASIQTTLAEGTYFLSITGTGKYDPNGYGYSDYGSLGQYFISGTLTGGTEPPPAAPSLSVSGAVAVAAEGDAGTTELTFVVSRTGDTSGSTAVDFSVIGSGDNPADAADFASDVLPQGTLTFAAGETSKTISVLVKGDTAVEADEAFTVSLSNATGGAAIAAAQASGTIVNDDAPPPPAGITVTPLGALVTSEDATSTSFSVVLDSRPDADVTIDVFSLDTTEGTVDVFSETLTFTADNWNVAQTVHVRGVDDFDVDGDVAYTVCLAGAHSADGRYDGLDADDLQLINQDNETGKAKAKGKAKGHDNGKGNPHDSDVLAAGALLIGDWDGGVAALDVDDVEDESPGDNQLEALVEALSHRLSDGKLAVIDFAGMPQGARDYLPAAGSSVAHVPYDPGDEFTPGALGSALRSLYGNHLAES